MKGRHIVRCKVGDFESKRYARKSVASQAISAVTRLLMQVQTHALYLISMPAWKSSNAPKYGNRRRLGILSWLVARQLSGADRDLAKVRCRNLGRRALECFKNTLLTGDSDRVSVEGCHESLE